MIVFYVPIYKSTPKTNKRYRIRLHLDVLLRIKRVPTSNE